MELLAAAGISLVVGLLAFVLAGVLIGDDMFRWRPENFVWACTSLACLLGMGIAYCLSFSKDDVEEARRSGYDEGYNQGYYTGYKNGNESGYEQAVEDIEWEYGIDIR